MMELDHAEEDGRRFVLVLKSVQGSSLKSLFEVLKELLNDVNIIATSSGLKIIAMDFSQCTLCHVWLDAEKFEVFHCPSPMVIGINIQNMYKLLKTVSSSDVLTMQIDEDNTNELEIIIQNSDRKAKTFFKLKLLDIDDQRISIPDVELTTQITMASADFQRLVKDQLSIGQVMRIHVKGSQVIFETSGDFASQKTILETESGADQEEIDLSFSLKILALFTKASSLSQTCTLFMQPDFPLVTQYAVAALGELRLVLAPKSQDI